MNTSLLALLAESLGLLLLVGAVLLGYVGLKGWRKWSDELTPLSIVLALTAAAYVFRMLSGLGGWIQLLITVLTTLLILLLASSLGEESDLQKEKR